MIGSLDASGQHGEAQRQYRRCRETLKQELGIDPDPATNELVARLLSGKGVSAVPRTPSASARIGVDPVPPPVAPEWPCVLPRFTIGVCPVRNLTGDPSVDHLADAFSQDLITDILRRHAIGFDIKWPPDETGSRLRDAKTWCDYVVAGSLQCSAPGLLRVNVRITDHGESKYLWAGRHEFKPSDLPLIQPRITARISRELCVALLKVVSEEAGPTGCDVVECIAKARAAWGKADFGREALIEAQRWFLAAVAEDPRDVEALRGLAMACRRLVDNPSWADARTRRAASYLEAEIVHIGRAIAPRAFQNAENGRRIEGPALDRRL